MKIGQKTLFRGIFPVVLSLFMTFFSCQKTDNKLNQLLIYNATSDTLAIKSNFANHNSVYPEKSYKMKTEESYTLYHLIDGFGAVSVYKNEQLVAKWEPHIISRPDSVCHSFFNVQSWEERKGGKNDKYMQFVFTIRPEDLNEIE